MRWGDGFRRESINRPPTPSAVEDRDKEPSLVEIINIKVITSSVPHLAGINRGNPRWWPPFWLGSRD
jgi:hypothetical protein